MSAAIQCDVCGVSLVLTSRGDDADGEISGWLKVTAAGHSFDVCTRACAKALMDDEDFTRLHDEHLEVVTDIARAIREAREQREDES